MTLAGLVDVSITTESAGLTRRGFSTALVAGYHTRYTDLARTYELGTAVFSLLADGFVASDQIVRAVTALASSTPKPERVVVGRLQNQPDQRINVIIAEIVAEGGEVYAITFEVRDGSDIPISYTAAQGDDQDDIAAALAVLVDTLADGFVDVGDLIGPLISLTPTEQDEFFYMKDYDRDLYESIEDVTSTDDIADDLEAIRLVNDDWYALILADSNGSNQMGEAGVWIEPQEKLFLAYTFDTECGDPDSTGDVMSSAKAGGFTRTIIIYNEDPAAYLQAGWASAQLPTAPGSTTWAFKTATDVTPDELPDAFANAIYAKSGNTYRPIGSLSVTQNGTMINGEFIDTVRGRDWLKIRLQERVFTLIATTPKVPFTNAGIDQVKLQVEAQMVEGIKAGYLSPDPVPVVTAPTVASIDPTNKAARHLPDVAFTANLANAVHAVTISGTLQV